MWRIEDQNVNIANLAKMVMTTTAKAVQTTIALALMAAANAQESYHFQSNQNMNVFQKVFWISR